MTSKIDNIIQIFNLPSSYKEDFYEQVKDWQDKTSRLNVLISFYKYIIQLKPELKNNEQLVDQILIDVKKIGDKVIFSKIEYDVVDRKIDDDSAVIFTIRNKNNEILQRKFYD